MAPKKNQTPLIDTEPPEEDRPDTTTTPLLVEKGKLLPTAVKFTAETLLKWLEDLATQHDKQKLGENAWQYVHAIYTCRGPRDSLPVSYEKRASSSQIAQE